MALPAKRLESLRSIIRQQVLAHMLQRLEATKTCEHPYPHFWLREVFPQEIYRQMLERLPRGSDYVPQKAKRFYK